MEPMAKAAAGAQTSQSDWAALKVMAGDGELLFESAAAEKCAKVCQNTIDKVDDHIHEARQLSRVEGFGSPIEGVQLAVKFRAKADEAVAVIQAHRQVLMDMRDTYRAAGKAYAETESANGAQYRANG